MKTVNTKSASASILYIVIPCYNEEEVLDEAAKRLIRKLQELIVSEKIGAQSRILFVDDGSKDRTWSLICNLHKSNKLVKGIKLSRNRGHQNALLAGLMTARKVADVTISLDADLQDDINAIDAMLEEYRNGAEIVYGVRSSREKDTFFKRSTALLFYKIMQKMGIDSVYNHADYRLMSSRVLNELANYNEVNLFLRGIVPLIGFKTAQVEYERAERFAGESKYPLRKMINFESIVKQCFATGFRDTTTCRERVRYATSRLDSIIASTEQLISDLSSQLSPTAEIVLVGYPLLSLDKTYILERCEVLERSSGDCLKFDRYNAAQEVRKAGMAFNDKQRALVNRWNATHARKVTFVDTIQSSFSTHEPEPHATGKNPIRWINEFFETEGSAGLDGKINSKFSFTTTNFYHPNITGHQKIALDIINTVGIPSSAKTITSTSSDTDLVFVVDTTGSMGGTIDQVKRDIPDLAANISALSRTTRFALVDFQDHPETGSPDDYPAIVRQTFTHDIDALTQSVNQLSLGFGGDWEETVYSGAMAGLGLDWRPGVKKIMIIIGDAPAKDPEPVTGYTWQQVAQKAYDVDPVEVYAIDVGYGHLTGSIYQLVEQTGGLSLIHNGDISTPILNSLRHSLAKPFGWIQGPYTIKVGDTLELDGSASHAVDGVINNIEWDLNGDSVYETSSPNLIYSHTFTAPFSGTIGIKITDSNGNVGYGSTRLDVTDDGDTVPQAIDNCPAIANGDQTDIDGDGVGDDCDDDIGWPTKDVEGVSVLTTEPTEPVQQSQVKTAVNGPTQSQAPTATLVNNTRAQPPVINATFNIPQSADVLGLSIAEQIPQPDSKQPKAPQQQSSNIIIVAITIVTGSIAIIAWRVIRSRTRPPKT